MVDHSVLLLCRNHGRFVADAVGSLLAQTRPPDEIIAYDAGSTDDTVAVLRRFGSRVRLIAGTADPRDPYATEARALRAAFDVSNGRILYLLEASDRFKPDKIARYGEAHAADPDAAMIQAPLETIDEQGRVRGIAIEPAYHVGNHLREIYRRHDVNLFYTMSALAFSRYYLSRIMGQAAELDLPLWMDARLALLAPYYGRVLTLPDPHTERRLARAAGRDRVSGALPIRQTLLRTRMFNQFCRRHGLRTISVWRNRRLYLQVLHLVLPEAMYQFFQHRLRPMVERV